LLTAAALRQCLSSTAITTRQCGGVGRSAYVLNLATAALGEPERASPSSTLKRAAEIVFAQHRPRASRPHRSPKKACALFDTRQLRANVSAESSTALAASTAATFEDAGRDRGPPESAGCYAPLNQQHVELSRSDPAGLIRNPASPGNSLGPGASILPTRRDQGPPLRLALMVAQTKPTRRRSATANQAGLRATAPPDSFARIRPLTLRPNPKEPAPRRCYCRAAVLSAMLLPALYCSSACKVRSRPGPVAY